MLYADCLWAEPGWGNNRGSLPTPRVIISGYRRVTVTRSPAGRSNRNPVQRPDAIPSAAQQPHLLSLVWIARRQRAALYFSCGPAAIPTVPQYAGVGGKGAIHARHLHTLYTNARRLAHATPIEASVR